MCTAIQFVTTSGSPAVGSVTHIHHGVDLSHCFVVSGELIDLHAIADQLAHDLYLKLVQLALGDGVCFGNDRDNVHLQQKGGQSRGEQQSWGGGGELRLCLRAAAALNARGKSFPRLICLHALQTNQRQTALNAPNEQIKASAPAYAFCYTLQQRRSHYRCHICSCHPVSAGCAEQLL